MHCRRARGWVAPSPSRLPHAAGDPRRGVRRRSRAPGPRSRALLAAGTPTSRSSRCLRRKWGYNNFPLFAASFQTPARPLVDMSGIFPKSWAVFGRLKTGAALQYECARARRARRDGLRAPGCDLWPGRGPAALDAGSRVGSGDRRAPARDRCGWPTDRPVSRRGRAADARGAAPAIPVPRSRGRLRTVQGRARAGGVARVTGPEVRGHQVVAFAGSAHVGGRRPTPIGDYAPPPSSACRSNSQSIASRGVSEARSRSRNSRAMRSADGTRAGKPSRASW